MKKVKKVKKVKRVKKVSESPKAGILFSLFSSPNGSKSIDFEPIWAGFTQNDMICSQIGLKKVKKVKRVKK